MGPVLPGGRTQQSLSTSPQWFFSVFSYQGNIYAPSSLLRDAFNGLGTVAVYNPAQNNFQLSQTLSNAEFIPLTKIGPQIGEQGAQIIYRPWHPVEFRGTLVYPVRSYSFTQSTYRSSYMNSIGFYVKPGLGRTPLFSCPFQMENPRRRRARDWGSVVCPRQCQDFSRGIYGLCVSNPNPYRFSAAGKEVLRFKSPNKARSFEYLNRTFYFGLGQDYGDPIGRSGTI